MATTRDIPDFPSEYHTDWCKLFAMTVGFSFIGFADELLEKLTAEFEKYKKDVAKK
jgi:hypothetical protein